jgi:hypothetical protein
MAIKVDFFIFIGCSEKNQCFTKCKVLKKERIPEDFGAAILNPNIEL